jgi:diaminohydroxyphosphoribosylaminopyrimidine deaminase/5-amino-6-(5-phosphoribosylamino)uracil reductase
LRAAGVEVIPGVLEKQCRDLNRDYFHHRRSRKPWVHLKMARTADGFAALPGGGGRITGEEVQKEVHRLRAAHQAILTGSGTVKTDSPRLNVRLAEGADPLRLVLSTNLDLDPALPLFSPPGAAWIIGGVGIPEDCVVPWEEQGVPVLLIPRNNAGTIDLRAFLEELGRRNIINLLVEAGPGLAGALLEGALVDELSLYQSPRSFGRGSPLACPGKVFPCPKAGLILVESRALGEDHLSRYERRENGGGQCLRA